MLAPNVILFPVKVTFFSNSNTKCKTVVRLYSSVSVHSASAGH